MKHLKSWIAATAVGLTVLVGATAGANAQQKIRFAYLKSTTLIPFFFAQEKG